MSIGKVEYRVREIKRYIVTRYHEGEGGLTGGTEQKGEYANADVAYEVGYALAKAEHQQLGWPVGDERITYPTKPLIGRDLRGNPTDLSNFGPA
jgi:hypothetical protein